MSSTAVGARGWLLAGAILLVAAGMTWACLKDAVAGYYAVADAAMALRWDPDSPDALSEVAWMGFLDARSAEDHEAASVEARRALRLAPMDTAALRVLGFDADRLGETSRARALFELAGARSHRDTLVESWLFDDALRRRSYTGASLAADALLRRRPELEAVLFPEMIRSLQDGRAVGPTVARLANKPEWRRSFLTEVAKTAGATVAEETFDVLAATGAPPTGEETSQLVERLVVAEDYQEARSEWTKLTPGSATRAPIYDGNFQGLPGAPPFNWRLIQSPGAFAEIAEADDGRPALHVQAPAAGNTELAEQLLVLTPGFYRLSGVALVSSEGKGNRFAWRIDCLPEGKPPLAEAVVAAGSETWRSFDADFEVPSQGCQAQRLSVDGLAHEGFQAAEAWYRGLTLITIRGAR